MGKSETRTNKQVRRDRQRQLQRQTEVARRGSGRRRSVLRLAGLVVAAVAMAAAFAVALHSSGSGAESGASTALGPPANIVASPPLGQFRRAGRKLTLGGKPELLFVGAQYCPYCAAERWAVVKALGQFGSFSGLKAGANGQGEGGFNLIPTFDWLKATYSSRYVSFDHKDVQDRNHNPLQALSPQEQSLFNRYDPTGSIPMVLVGGYVMDGSGYDPSAIDGKSFAAVQRGLQDGTPASYVWDVNAEANVLTALLCHGDGGRPRPACGR
ncbi:MAG: DUF929 family protein, partial [Chloroflexi bacterium]|nr:DUF929 family protein [Chloroflexota bacterium]